jgi:hypothetical protein
MLLLTLLNASPSAVAKTIERTADATLKVAEMNHGDTLHYRLLNGQTRTFVLEGTRARIVENPRGGILYSFECDFRADGQPVTLRRFVCSQETFYEPWVINGVRLWISSSAAIFKLVPVRYPTQHYKFDEVDAVVAFQDATERICPEPMWPWFPMDKFFIDVGTCYGGDDPWLGPFVGKACHVGLDINMPKLTPLYAPISFDDNWIFSDDHRWRAVRRWPNGEVWGLQSHHVERLLIPQGTPVPAGLHYAEGAGKAIGAREHSHFEFRYGPEALNRGAIAGIELDPWILFWQIFEDANAAKGALRAQMDPIAPGKTGEPVAFSARATRGGKAGADRRYTWAFGDGGFSVEPAPRHTFARAGVYPVTLVVEQAGERAVFTQHVSVSGAAVTRPAMVLDAPDEVSFHPRPGYAANVYGWAPKTVPATLRFAAKPDGAVSTPRIVTMRSASDAALPAMKKPVVTYSGPQKDWLRITSSDSGKAELAVSVNPAALPMGRHEAVVALEAAPALNAQQVFRVELHVREAPSAREFVVDDRDDGFFATPFVWVGHQFRAPPLKGHAKRYLTNGGMPEKNAIARFTPDLAQGRYQVAFHAEMPPLESELAVRIRHAKGEERVRFTPSKDGPRTLGEFDFAEGNAGFVEISGAESTGIAVADAIVFRRLPANSEK